ncbi:hypothetical protein MMC09_002841 [Bachmanniomyces sp. S44760]|nr:hypothetical protein [Bachmanniomyces sp. S44760]
MSSSRVYSRLLPPLYSIRRAAIRALSSPSTILCSKPGYRSITTLNKVSSTSSTSTLQSNRSAFAPKISCRLFASSGENVTQSEPEADGATTSHAEADNSIAASSRNSATSSSDGDANSTATELDSSESEDGRFAKKQDPSIVRSVSSTARSVANTASDAVGAVARGLSNAKDHTAEAMGEVTESPALYIGNMFFETTEEDLKRYIEQVATVKSVKIIYDARGMSKGFGYVEMADLPAAGAVIAQLNQMPFAGRRLSIQYQTRRPPRNSSGRDAFSGFGGSREPHPPTRTLFVGNMSFDMSDKDLHELFRDVRNVTDIRVAIDRRTGQPRGFAHADFTDVRSAEKGMEYLKEKEVYGRRLRVDFSESSNNSRKAGMNSEHLPGRDM